MILQRINTHACSSMQPRRWLLGLLMLQSMSSFVLDSYQQLLRDHLVVTLFLTMLVGAGGNAGNQSAIKVIRGLVWPPARPTRVTSKFPAFSITLPGMRDYAQASGMIRRA